ncbi:hypothetical protein [Saccharothrix lopnurensis]|uniref:Uncharacterized protein n=1 Tax=Saccharothrix lopnurensis TaxID=1670621 RepID=A0ABW1PBR4_9PSEU
MLSEFGPRVNAIRYWIDDVSWPLALGRGEQPPQLGLEPATTLTVRGSTALPP